MGVIISQDPVTPPEAQSGPPGPGGAQSSCRASQSLFGASCSLDWTGNPINRCFMPMKCTEDKRPTQESHCPTWQPLPQSIPLLKVRVQTLQSPELQAEPGSPHLTSLSGEKEAHLCHQPCGYEAATNSSEPSGWATWAGLPVTLWKGQRPQRTEKEREGGEPMYS